MMLAVCDDHLDHVSVLLVRLSDIVAGWFTLASCSPGDHMSFCTNVTLKPCCVRTQAPCQRYDPLTSHC